MKLKPLGDRLIVKPVEEEETTASGLVLPETAKEKPQKGTVLAVGDGAVAEDGATKDRIAERLTKEIPAAVAADSAYQNAIQHSDKQNARRASSQQRLMSSIRRAFQSSLNSAQSA